MAKNLNEAHYVELIHVGEANTTCRTHARPSHAETFEAREAFPERYKQIRAQLVTGGFSGDQPHAERGLRRG